MENKLKNRIMRRIYAIWFVKRVVPLSLGSAVFIDVALRESARRFFVAQIFANFWKVASSNLWAVPRFVESALNHVEPSVLVLISMAGFLGFTLAVELFRNLRQVISTPSVSPATNSVKR